MQVIFYGNTGRFTNRPYGNLLSMNCPQKEAMGARLREDCYRGAKPRREAGRGDPESLVFDAIQEKTKSWIAAGFHPSRRQ